MNSKINLIMSYLTGKGLKDLATKKFRITFIDDTNNKSIELILNGFEDRDSAQRRLRDCGFLSSGSSGYKMIYFSNWEYDPVFVGSTLISCSDFVCQLKTNVIHLQIEPSYNKGAAVELYGCPNALIHDAEKLRASKKIMVRKYE